MRDVNINFDQARFPTLKIETLCTSGLTQIKFSGTDEELKVLSSLIAPAKITTESMIAKARYIQHLNYDDIEKEVGENSIAQIMGGLSKTAALYRQRHNINKAEFNVTIPKIHRICVDDDYSIHDGDVVTYEQAEKLNFNPADGFRIEVGRGVRDVLIFEWKFKNLENQTEFTKLGDAAIFGQKASSVKSWESKAYGSLSLIQNVETQHTIARTAGILKTANQR